MQDDVQATIQQKKKGQANYLTVIIIIAVLALLVSLYVPFRTEIHMKFITWVVLMPDGKVHYFLEQFIRNNATGMFLEPLVRLMKHPNDDVKFFADLTLEQKADFIAPAQLDFLEHMALDKNQEVSNDAVYILNYNARATRDFSRLIHMVKDPEYSLLTHCLVIEILGTVAYNTQEPEVIEALLVCLKDPRVEIRLKAIESLRYVNDEVIIKPLVQMLQDRDSRVHLLAVVALTNMAEVNSPVPSAHPVTRQEVEKHALELLKALLKDDNPEVRRKAFEALKLFKTPWSSNIKKREDLRYAK